VQQPQQQPQQWQLPRNPTPTSPAPQPVINPSRDIPVDNSGWNVPKAGRPSQPMDPSAWQAYAGNANYQPPGEPGRASQPFLPPVAPSFPVVDRNDRSGALTTPPTKTYDPNRDAAVGRIIWIVALVLFAVIAVIVYKFAL
jgi:hypothetical protein